MTKGEDASRLVIGSARMEVREACLQLADSAGYRVVGTFASGRDMMAHVPALGADLALLDSKMEDVNGLQLSEGMSAYCPCILILSPRQMENMTVIPSGGDRYYVGLHFSRQAILQTMDFALAAARRMRALEEEMDRLRGQQARRRNVNIAKGLLMKALNMSESAAHHWLQRRSMETGRSLEQLAEEILAAGTSALEEMKDREAGGCDDPQ